MLKLGAPPKIHPYFGSMYVNTVGQCIYVHVQTLWVCTCIDVHLQHWRTPELAQLYQHCLQACLNMHVCLCSEPWVL